MATTNTSDLMDGGGNSNYCKDYLPSFIVERLEAGAFRKLCEHLRERSDSVQNIDLMTVGGFCRNCLAKWMVVEARKLSDNNSEINVENVAEIRRSLDALGYDEAAQYVYGMNYGEWKKRHLKDASEDQMKRYNDSLPIQATHDKKLLEARATKPAKPLVITDQTAKLGSKIKENSVSTGSGGSLLSDVCCQDVEEMVATNGGGSDAPSGQPAPSMPAKKSSLSALTFHPPPPPEGGITFSLAVLTVSDRASANLYDTGDLSGPAVVQSMESVVKQLSTTETPVACNIIVKSIVADEMDQIQDKLKEWCDHSSPDRIDLILTTGGTGFAPRDVTPEATRSILDRECSGLLSFVTTECSALQPLASLSRGTAGLRGSTFIANLPGNPKSVEQILPILVPILLHAIHDLKKS